MKPARAIDPQYRPRAWLVSLFLLAKNLDLTIEECRVIARRAELLTQFDQWALAFERADLRHLPRIAA
jgi:hypothetical protein